MNTIIINDESRGTIIRNTENKIGSILLNVMAASYRLTGTIEGIVEGEKCSQQYCVTYKNGTRVRFRVRTFIKGRS